MTIIRMGVYKQDVPRTEGLMGKKDQTDRFSDICETNSELEKVEKRHQEKVYEDMQEKSSRFVEQHV